MAFCRVGAKNRRALAKGARGYTHLLVTIDKFSKLVDVRPITNLRAKQAVTFFTDMIYRFGVPNSIITDNGSQFPGRKFLEFCDKFHIRVDWEAVAHQQTNGQVEQANGMILQGLQPRIFDRLNKFDRKWLQELPAVVWSLRTTPSRATEFTSFFLVYGAEALLPTNLEYGSPRVRDYDEGTNQRAREDSQDQLDEARTVALMDSARYQQALRRYQARKIRRGDFNEGDLVLRLRQDNRGCHKLSPPWEGSYVVFKVLKPSNYKLANEDGEELTNAWNIQQLCLFYSLKGFPSSFCYLQTQHPNWLYGCKFHRINKIKGRLGFPLKTKSPSGANAGGALPLPPKNGPIFSQKTAANVLSMPRPKFWVNLRGTRVAKGRRSVSQG
jgi:transposase InsO family protein